MKSIYTRTRIQNTDNCIDSEVRFHSCLMTSWMTKHCVLFQAKVHTSVFDKLSQRFNTRNGTFVLILYNPMGVLLKEIKNRKPNFDSHPISPHHWEVVGKRLVVHEDSWRNVECDHYIQRIMAVGGKDGPHSTETVQPQSQVKQTIPTGRICKRYINQWMIPQCNLLWKGIF